MRKSALAALAVLAALVAWAPGAGGQTNNVTIRKLDVTNFPVVKISAQVDGDEPALNAFTVRENGRILSPPPEVVPIGKTDTPVGVVLAIDVSGSMRAGAKLVAAKEAAKQFVANKQPNDQIAVVAFNDVPQVKAGFTDDPAKLNAAIDGLAATGETALYDGVRAAATLFNDRPDLQPNIVVLSDGKDTVSQNGLAEAQASVVGAKSSVFTVGLKGGRDFDAGALSALAQAGGGKYVETNDPAQLKALYGSIQRAIHNQYELTYTSKDTSGNIQVTVGAGGQLATAGPVAVGSVAVGRDVAPVVVHGSRFGGLLGNGPALAIVAGLGFLAVGLVVFGASALTREGVPTLSTTLQPYGPGGGTAFESGSATGGVELAQTAIMRRAVDATARIAAGGSILDTLERKLEQADLPVRPAEALFFYLASLAAAVVFTLLLWGPFVALLAGIVIGLAPIAVLDFLGGRRQRKFTAQLPDVLRVIASSLRAGFSLLQAADAASEQVDDPMAKELRRVLVETRLGRPLESALDDSAKRTHSPDFDWAVMAIGIQREVGGNLAELLSTVADTMVARERLRQEVRTLTAEGRLSAIVLILLPLALGGFIFFNNRSYLDPLFHETIGQFMLIGTVVLMVVGYIWMRKIVDVPI
ncbi:MAG TPA: VWA domain-containing protein [Acidimicrobiales bacterium]|nr:VWA domain-containing protein [Acidimicrobiales bacterium]